MRPTDDIAPLVDIAEEEWNRRVLAAQAALNDLHDMWTRLYGPSEVLTDSYDELRALDALFYLEEDAEAVA